MKEIKCTTKYNEKLTKKFLNVYFFEKMKYPRWIVNVCIIIIIVDFFRAPELTVINTIVFIFSLLGILELNTSFLPNFNYKKMVKRKDKILSATITYVFKERNIKITSDKTEYIDYKELYQVIEVTDAYYLYLNSSKAFIVSKNSLSAEEIENLSNTFKNNIKKFKVINK